jgi:hypothetical protein
VPAALRCAAAAEHPFEDNAGLISIGSGVVGDCQLSVFMYAQL